MHLKLSALPLAAMLAISTLALPAHAQDAANKPRTLSLTGIGKVTSAPDMATISSGVVTEAKTAREALSVNNKAMAQVIETIKAAGVAVKDIQTSNFSVQPKYTYFKASSSERKPPKITGYTVSNTVTTIVRDLDTLGPVMDAVVTSGVNQIGGLSFTVAEPKPLRNEARKKAVAEALERAELYAAAAGVTLGNILSITESGGAQPPRPVFAQARAASADAAVPIAQGEQSITMQVNIVWEIK